MLGPARWRPALIAGEACLLLGKPWRGGVFREGQRVRRMVKNVFKKKQVFLKKKKNNKKKTDTQ